MRSDNIRVLLRLFGPWLTSITSANQFDRMLAETLTARLHEIADEADAPVQEVRAADPLPGPSVRFVGVPGNAAPRPATAGAVIVPLFPRNPE